MLASVVFAGGGTAALDAQVLHVRQRRLARAPCAAGAPAWRSLAPTDCAAALSEKRSASEVARPIARSARRSSDPRARDDRGITYAACEWARVDDQGSARVQRRERGLLRRHHPQRVEVEVLRASRAPRSPPARTRRVMRDSSSSDARIAAGVNSGASHQGGWWRCAHPTSPPRPARRSPCRPRQSRSRRTAQATE